MRSHESILVFYKKQPTYNPQMGIGKRKFGIRKSDRNGTNYGKFKEDKKENYDDGGARYPQSVIEFTNGNRNKQLTHPTQKPVELIRYLIKTYSNEGGTIFDGYMGSQSARFACYSENRNFIGSEMDKDYFNDGCNRFELFKQQQKLF